MKSHRRAGLRVEIGAAAQDAADAGRTLSATSQGFALVPHRAREGHGAGAGPSKTRMRRCSPSSPTVNHGRARRLALALGASQAHRAAGTRPGLRHKAKVQSFRSRAGRAAG